MNRSRRPHGGRLTRVDRDRHSGEVLAFLSPGGVACSRCSWLMTGGSFEEQHAALTAHNCTDVEGEP